jgi:hypothetical protein
VAFQLGSNEPALGLEDFRRAAFGANQEPRAVGRKGRNARRRPERKRGAAVQRPDPGLRLAASSAIALGLEVDEH